MKYKLTNKQLFNSFKSIMREYSELDSAERSYDYYKSEKHRYVDANVVNYYDDLEMDWESDDWIFQVQYERGDWGHGLELPILRYTEYMNSGRFMTIKSLFGNLFEPLLKEWFNNTYPVKTPIKTVTKEYD
jgi:hypothetical protein